MTLTGDHTAEVLTLLSHEPSELDDMPDLAGRLQRLCRTARRDLGVWGVGVGVLLESGEQVMDAASDPATALVEDLQFALGEGPSRATFDSRIPVLVPDLNEAASTTWPNFGPAAYDHGVRAVFAFPLHVGRVRLGAFNVYRDEPGSLSRRALSRALIYAHVAKRTMLQALQSSDETSSPFGDGDLSRFEVYQAQGMVMAHYGVGADEALSLMRGHAFAHHRSLKDVARDIVGRRDAAKDFLSDRNTTDLPRTPTARRKRHDPGPRTTSELVAPTVESDVGSPSTESVAAEEVVAEAVRITVQADAAMALRQIDAAAVEVLAVPKVQCAVEREIAGTAVGLSDSAAASALRFAAVTKGRVAGAALVAGQAAAAVRAEDIDRQAGNGDWAERISLAPRPTSASGARDFVRRQLVDHGLPDLVDDICLVANELATNAIQHARTPYVVTLEKSGQGVTLAVQDGSPSLPNDTPTRDTDVDGRGLTIVQCLSSKWGVTVSADGSKLVWASFASTPS